MVGRAANLPLTWAHSLAYLRVQHKTHGRKSDMNKIAGKIAAGAASGFAATVPMTAAMEIMHRVLPATQRYALPPRHVTMNVADALQLKHKLDEEQRRKLTLAAHFGYGSAMGGIFAALNGQVPGPAL